MDEERTGVNRFSVEARSHEGFYLHILPHYSFQSELPRQETEKLENIWMEQRL